MNSNIRTSAGGNRNLGLHGAGKGDADRTSDTTAYAERLAEVTFPHLPPEQDGFTKSKRGWRKVYGAVEQKPTRWADSPIHEAVERFEDGLV